MNRYKTKDVSRFAIKRAVRLAVIVGFQFLASSTSFAQLDSTCLEQVRATFNSHDKVTLVGRFLSPLGSRLIVGKISSIDLQNSTVTMRDMVDNICTDSVFNGCDLEEIRCRRMGQFQPEIVGGCFFIGSFVGLIICTPFRFFNYGHDDVHSATKGLVIGGAIGLGVGLIGSLITPSERTIRCE